jgi:hypothetical protein
MTTMPVRDAIEKLSKVFAQAPEKARSRNPPATATLESGLRFQVTASTENGSRRTCRRPSVEGDQGRTPAGSSGPRWRRAPQR